MKEKVNRVELPRFSWTDFFIGLAYAVSKKSSDAQTQCGCIITDVHHRILGVGYNGFPRGANDRNLPNLRPEKYPWMFHAEVNALANCEHRPENGIAYITGEPCNQCLFSLHQHGIRNVYFGEQEIKMLDQEDKEWQEKFICETGIGLHKVSPNLSWLVDLGNEVAETILPKIPKST